MQAVHVKFFEARGAKSMPAVNHDSWDFVIRVVIFFAERAFVFIEEFTNELINLFAE